MNNFPRSTDDPHHILYIFRYWYSNYAAVRMFFIPRKTITENWSIFFLKQLRSHHPMSLASNILLSILGAPRSIPLTNTTQTYK